MLETNPLRRRRGLELAVLAVALAACILPFATKAYHIDDTLFVWAAQHISERPFDFYGFDVHWYATWEPMSRVTQNPPAACYYLALAGSMFGWGEVALHVAMLFPAWGTIWATYRLAERFGTRPLPAALLTLFTPAMLVCGTSVMCDVMMLCFWLWTILVWDRGLRERRADLLAIAGGLIALTTVTKYFGVCLIPLLGVFSFAADRAGWRRWGVGLGVALLLLVLYQAVFTWLYAIDRGLTGAMGYAAAMGQRSLGGGVFRLFEGLGFVGGCVGIAGVLAVLRLRWRSQLAIGIVLIAAACLCLFLRTTSTLPGDYVQQDSPFVEGGGTYGKGELLWQFLLWVTAGAGVLLLVVEDLRTHRDAVALLLFLWVFGTFAFAAYVNWALNGRSVLPMVPAVALVLVRRLDRKPGAGWVLPTVLAASAALAVSVTVADCGLANANRAAARRLAAAYAPPAGRTLWFRGHWGFQYYMQQAGARAWDDERAAGRRGEVLIIPDNNTNQSRPEEITTPVATVRVAACPWAATMSPSAGAGFYACSYDWRPLAFAFTDVPPESYVVFRLTADQPPPAK